MIPNIHTLFDFISIPFENQHQVLNMKKINRGQIKFREYWIALLQPMTVIFSYKLRNVTYNRIANCNHSQAGDADSSRAPGLTSWFQGSGNVHRGALLLVSQWQCISFFFCILHWTQSIDSGPLGLLLKTFFLLYVFVLIFPLFKTILVTIK